MRIRFIALALCLLAAGVSATTARPRQVTCPVCEEEITVLVVMSSNTFGGPDLDLCTHAAGEDPRTLAVWTCPSCLYSRYSGSFEKPVGGELAGRVRKELESPLPRAGFTSQRSIPGWLKYQLAGKIIEWDGAGPLPLLDHYIEAAWTVRCESWQDLDAVREDPDLSERLAELEESIGQWATDSLDEDPEDPFQRRRTILLQGAELLRLATAPDLAMAEVGLRRLLGSQKFRYRGECAVALPILTALARDETMPEALRTAALASISGITRERGFQEQVLYWFQQTREQAGLGPEHLPAYCYIAGDTLRMLSREEEAAALYQEALRQDLCPMTIAALAREGLRRVGAEGPTAAQAAEDRKRRLVRLGELLLDPETTTAARNQIEYLRDPALTPAVVRAMGSDNQYVRANAAMALRYLPEPGPAAIDALTVLLFDPEEDPRWMAAVTMERIAPPEAREKLEEVAGAEEYERVRQLAIETLGVAGDTGTLEILLKNYYLDTKEVEFAISRLLNCASVEHFENRGELLDWIEANRPGDRRSWVRAGFREAGIEIGNPWDRKNVPALLGLLDHEHHWVRANAVRVLREVSGRRLPGYEIGRDATYPRALQERRAAIATWREWWESQKSK